MFRIHELVLGRQGSAGQLGLDAPGNIVLIAVPPDLPPRDGAPDEAHQNAQKRDEHRPAVRIFDEAGRHERAVGREQRYMHSEEELVISASNLIRLLDSFEALLVFLEEDVSLGLCQATISDTE